MVHDRFLFLLQLFGETAHGGSKLLDSSLMASSRLTLDAVDG